MVVAHGYRWNVRVPHYFIILTVNFFVNTIKCNQFVMSEFLKIIPVQVVTDTLKP